VLPSHEQQPSNDESQEYSYLAVWEERRNRVINILKKHHCQHILDLGCGEGRLFQAMKFMSEFRRLVGLEIDRKEILKSYERVGPMTYHIFRDDPPEEPLEVAIYCGDLTRPFPTLRAENVDAITMVEVIEHLPADALECLPFVLFGFYRPRVIIISTPNREYNKCIKGFDLNTFRHYDHKFEWTRKEFQDWCTLQLSKFDGYEVTYQTVGRVHPSAEEDFFSVKKHGRCTQIAVFLRKPEAQGPNLKDPKEYSESGLSVIKNFKFPSKRQIENLKISHSYPAWDDEDTQEPDHYEYSEDNTEFGDEVDPEWWKVVWNKSDDDVREGQGNGQGWDETDPLAIGSWLDDETWAEDFKDDTGSQGDHSPVISSNSQGNTHEENLNSDTIHLEEECCEWHTRCSVDTPLTDDNKTVEKPGHTLEQDSSWPAQKETVVSSRSKHENDQRLIQIWKSPQRVKLKGGFT